MSLRDIRRYTEQLAERKIAPGDFFKEGVYKDTNNQARPLYNITKKGCEFIAHKLTGIKGTEFTARYINRFHDMEDTIRKGISETDKQSKSKKKDMSNRLPLPSVNTMVKNITKTLEKAGVDEMYIAAEVKRIYTDAGYPVNAPLLTDSTMPELYDCTSMAKELGVMSTSGKPHGKAISAVIQKISVDESEIVKTAYSRNGHDGVTVQYKGSVFEKVKEWLESSGYPTIIEYRQSDGSITRCQVVYQEVA